MNVSSYAGRLALDSPVLKLSRRRAVFLRSLSEEPRRSDPVPRSSQVSLHSCFCVRFQNDHLAISGEAESAPGEAARFPHRVSEPVLGPTGASVQSPSMSCRPRDASEMLPDAPNTRSGSVE